jgi:hypothetical protein
LNYNSLEIYIVTPASASKHVLSVKCEGTIPKRDLRHPGLKENDEKKGLTMSREVY